MNIEGPRKLNSSGYIGSGFKFTEKEWSDGMAKLKLEGKTEEAARAELVHREEVVRERHRMAQEEKSA